MKSWIKNIFGFGVASFLSDFNHEMSNSLVPVLVAQFVGQAQAPLFLGIISSISDAFSSFLRLFSGFLSDHLSHKKPLIMLGYGISAIFSTLAGFTHSIGSLFFYRMLSFTGSGLREPPRDALITTLVEPANYGRAFGLKNAMDTLGSLVGPLVAFMCVGIFSIHSIFLLAFIPGIGAVFAILFLTKDMPLSTTKSPITPRAFFNDIALLPRSFLAFLGIILIFDLSNFNKLLLLSRAQEILPADTATISAWLVLLYAFFNAARAIGELFIGLLSDYVNRIILLALLGCGTFSGVAFLLMTPHASFIYCAFVFILAGISSATIVTLKKACAGNMLPAQIRGLGFGVLQASEGFASLISSALIGFLWTHYSPNFSFQYVITLSLLSAILLLIFGLIYRRS